MQLWDWRNGNEPPVHNKGDKEPRNEAENQGHDYDSSEQPFFLNIFYPLPPSFWPSFFMSFNIFKPYWQSPFFFLIPCTILLISHFPPCYPYFLPPFCSSIHLILHQYFPPSISIHLILHQYFPPSISSPPSFFTSWSRPSTPLSLTLSYSRDLTSTKCVIYSSSLSYTITLSANWN